MNLRERAWRAQMARMVATLDQMIAGKIEDAWRLDLIVLRDRLAGALGADEGNSTTAELRERARRDYDTAAEIVGQSATLDLPGVRAPSNVKTRTMAGFGPARPRHGDRA